MNSQAISIAKHTFLCGAEQHRKDLVKEAASVFSAAIRKGQRSSNLYCWRARAEGYMAILARSWHERVLYVTRSFISVLYSIYLNPKNALAHFVLASWLTKMRIPLTSGLAVTHFTRAVELDPQKIVYRISKARWHRDHSQSKEMKTEARKILMCPVWEVSDLRRREEAKSMLADIHNG